MFLLQYPRLGTKTAYKIQGQKTGVGRRTKIRQNTDRWGCGCGWKNVVGMGTMVVGMGKGWE